MTSTTYFENDPTHASPPGARGDTARFLVGLGIALVVSILLACRYWAHVVDDAYISLRYAENLIAGHGLVFNPGEPVEGYTNFLWTLMLAVGRRVGCPPEGLVRGLGLTGALGTIFTLAVWVRSIAGSGTAALAALLLGLTMPFAVWATAGLETPLFAALVTAGIAAFSPASGRAGARRLGLGAAAFTLASLTRPEGLVFFAVAVAWRLVVPIAPRSTVLAISVLIAGAGLVPHALWRHATYDAWLPNTYAAKVSFAEAGLAYVPRGWHYLTRFAADLPVLAFAPLLGLLAVTRVRALAPLTLAGVTVIAGALMIVLVGGDGLTADRFVVPLLPLVAAVLAVGALAPVRRAWASRPGGTRASARVSNTIVSGAVASVALVIGVIGALAQPHRGGRILDSITREQDEVSAWREIGKWIRTSTDQDAVVAVTVAGAIPYYSERATIDLLGLTDPVIAATPVPEPGREQAGHERSNPDHVLDRAPDLVVIGEYALHPSLRLDAPPLSFFYRAERDLVDSPRFRRDYELRAGRTGGGHFYYFAHRDLGGRR